MALEIRKEIRIKGVSLDEDPILYFDNIGSAPGLAAITVDSFSSGSSGELIFKTASADVLSQSLRIMQNGELLIGSGAMDTSAVLQIDSVTKGVLLPRNPDPATNILTPAPGLLAYDSADNEMQYYNGTSWVSLGGGTITGSGTTNTIPIFTGATALGNSTIVYDGESWDWNVGAGQLKLSTSNSSYVSIFPSGNNMRFELNSGASTEFTWNALTGNHILTLPSATGTIALTSDLSGYLPLSGGTMTGAINFIDANSYIGFFDDLPLDTRVELGNTKAIVLNVADSIVEWQGNLLKLESPDGAFGGKLTLNSLGDISFNKGSSPSFGATSILSFVDSLVGYNYQLPSASGTVALTSQLTDDGIYTGSGSLSGATVVTMATNNFTMSSAGDGNLFDIDATNNSIGIGIAPVSSAKLVVTKTLTTIPTSSILGLVGQTVLTDIAVGNATAQLVGVVGQAVWNQTTVGQSLTKETSMVGGFFKTVLTDDGTVLEAQGVISKIFTETANGTVTEFSGIRADIDANSLGTIGTFIGLKIEDLSGRSGTIPSAHLRYGVYQEDAGNNYFNGTVGVGMDGGATAEALMVAGNIEVVGVSTGLILQDRTLGTRYEVYMDNGTLVSNAL